MQKKCVVRQDQGATSSPSQLVLTDQTAHHVEAEDDAVGSLLFDEAVEAEKRMSLLRDGVVAVVKQFFKAELAEDLCGAYDSGITSGFYGKGSIIAQGHRRWLVRRIRTLRHADGTAMSVQMMCRLNAVGVKHGEGIRLREQLDSERLF
ncbi:hypothetical protein [Burkholderia gladioli]|uniref:hypothetical protein n=1 Tax=Burkholderia gladioli TaxID=28095 RepID=UPI001640BF7E|nr:hypothetical protein [Burkholderia gladioli]